MATVHIKQKTDNGGTVLLKWESAEVDPIQFKPSKPIFIPQDEYVLVDLDNQERNFNTLRRDGYLTPRGMALTVKLIKIAMMAIEDGKEQKRR
mgnify:CR=1 FL=1